MTRGLSRIILVLLTVLGPTAAAPALIGHPAQAQPVGSGDTSAPKFLKLSVDSVTPTAVSTVSDPVLTVSGTVTNIGDRMVDDVSIRLQRAHPVGEPSELRTALRLDEVNYEIATPFQDIAEQLSPGQRQQFTLSVPLRSVGEPSLRISETGVYPLLLNVNGVPDYGGQARLDDARFLLPVLGLPPAEGAAPVPPPTAAPVATTLLWPLADRPRLVAGVPGTVPAEVELTDDELGAALAKGGRLDQLLTALETAFGSETERDRGAVSAVCIAIDPDLLLTVQAMTAGYRVLASPSDPDGATREGSGAEHAQNWLARLRALASSMCTVALPFAQIDPAALAAVNDPAITARALGAPAEVVDSILGTASVRGVSVPDSGSIDDNAARMLREHGFTTAVLAGNATAPETAPTDAVLSQNGTADGSIGTGAAPDLVRLPGITASNAAETAPPAVGPGSDDRGSARPSEPALRVATFDIWSATALAAVGSNPPTPSFTPDPARYEVTNDSRAARLQDALGALSWTALNPQAPRPRSQLLMPPQQWGANLEEATALLSQVKLLFQHGLAAPRKFTDLLAQQPDPMPYRLAYLDQAAYDAVPRHLVDPVHDQSNRVTQLLRAMVEVPQAELTPRMFMDPLRDDLLRALTLSDRRGRETTQAEVFAQRRINQVTEALDEIYRSVTVLPPGGVYTLASEQSPLLLVARNDLPVPVRIRFRIDAPTATKITDIGEQQLPPRGTRSFQIPTEVSDSRKLVIPISLTTPDGVALGNATSVSVRSNAYGQTLAIITACAAILLLLLAGRRLWRRFHGQPDPADKGIDPGVRQRVNRYGRARRRLGRRQGREPPRPSGEARQSTSEPIRPPEHV